MALKLDHVLGETATNLRRNFLMSMAAVVTVAVSLSLVGGVFLLRQGVNKATLQWRGDVQLSAFMNADATQQQIDAVDQQLKGMPEVKSYRFVDKPGAYAEAQKLFASDPVTLSSLSVDKMPPSFRIVPTNTQFIDSVGERFNGKTRREECCLRQRRYSNHGYRHARAASWFVDRGHRFVGLSDAANSQRHSRRNFRPTARGLSDEAGGRHKLVHTHPVHVGGVASGPDRGRHCLRYGGRRSGRHVQRQSQPALHAARENGRNSERGHRHRPVCFGRWRRGRRGRLDRRRSPLSRHLSAEKLTDQHFLCTKFAIKSIQLSSEIWFFWPIRHRETDQRA